MEHHSLVVRVDKLYAMQTGFGMLRSFCGRNLFGRTVHNEERCGTNKGISENLFRLLKREL